MARTNTPNKSPGKGSGRTGKRGSGNNRSVSLVLAGITALAILAIAAFAVFSTAGTGGDAGGFTPNDQGLIPKGQQAPGFTAETVDGGSVSVQDGNAEPTMLVFFATWCPHCNNEAPVISELESEYEDLEVVMVGIDGQDDPGKVRQFVEKYSIESPAVYQPSLGQDYQVSGYPTVYVLDAEGKVVAANAGEAPREAYEGWIEEALG